MARRNKQRVAERHLYRIDVDEAGRVVCLDHRGHRVPLGRCFRLGLGNDPDSIQWSIRKSCIFGKKFEEQVKTRIEKGGKTIWARVDDEDGFEGSRRKKGHQ